MPLLAPLLFALLLAPSDTSTNVRSLPITELRAAHRTSKTLVVFLSGDGGWADLDQKIGLRLQSRGVDVVGFDMRDYLRSGRRDPEGMAIDVGRVARRYMALWQLDSVALVGYSRGSDLAPFVANRLAPDVRGRLSRMTMLTLLERASFVYHFWDLWSTTSGKHDTPVLPELEKLRGLPMLCIYGSEEKESLCRTAPPGLMTVVARKGKHHFDGNYDALADIMYDAMKAPAKP